MVPHLEEAQPQDLAMGALKAGAEPGSAEVAEMAKYTWYVTLGTREGVRPRIPVLRELGCPKQQGSSQPGTGSDGLTQRRCPRQVI